MWCPRWVAVTGAIISNMVPPELTGVTWTCTGQNNGVCGMTSGTGALTTAANLPVWASVTYVVSGTIIAGSGPGLISYLVNVATPVPVADPNPGNNRATDALTLAAGPVAA